MTLTSIHHNPHVTLVPQTFSTSMSQRSTTQHIPLSLATNTTNALMPTTHLIILAHINDLDTLTISLHLSHHPYRPDNSIPIHRTHPHSSNLKHNLSHHTLPHHTFNRCNGNHPLRPIHPTKLQLNSHRS